MSDFLLELRSEEIPARMQAGARAELKRLFHREMSAAGISLADITVWSTPRRLALIAHGLPEATQAVREEAKGPPEGAPDEAIKGFCRKNGVTRDQLELREVRGRNTFFAVVERPGRATRDLLADAIAAIIRDFAWPKSMRWGRASLSTRSPRWVRPLSGIVALLDNEVVECSCGDVASGNITQGHRFHSDGDIEISGTDDYVERLRAAHVIIDHEEREEIIRQGASRVAQSAGLRLVADEGLVIENAGLSEWPVPLLGRFDEEYLDVPPEVIQLTARVNQKYFVCEDLDGRLANAFVCTANIEALEPQTVIDGNRKVLAARLSDARFFWDLDQKTTLAEHAGKLARITFHEKLGTLADKAERIAGLARWLCEEGIIKADPDLAEQAARLAKADLVTEMVGEFPELQGLMGAYYAEHEGLEPQVIAAIRDHYKPVGQGDEVPTAPVSVAVSLADKLDTLRSFFSIDERPTGSKDPFALRRAALGIIQLIQSNKLRMSVGEGDLLDFFADRLKVQQREAGVRHDLIDAVFALGAEDDLLRLLDRVNALQGFMDTEDGANLLAGYKRAANILKKENWLDKGEVKELSYTPEPAERALIDVLNAAEPDAGAAIEMERFEDAMVALASLRAPIDRFFDEVTVNAEEEIKRASRLDLLARFRAAVHKVADFSRIEG